MSGAEMLRVCFCVKIRKRNYRREQTDGYRGSSGGLGEGWRGDGGVSGCKLLPVEWISNKV